MEKQEQNLDQLPDSAQISVKDVARLLRVCEMTVWRMSKSGTIPEPKRITARCTRWEMGKLRQALGIGRYSSAA